MAGKQKHDLTIDPLLMDDETLAAYYAVRHVAIASGDDNALLPSGKTVRQEREEYAALCAAQQVTEASNGTNTESSAKSGTNATASQPAKPAKSGNGLNNG